MSCAKYGGEYDSDCQGDKFEALVKYETDGVEQWEKVAEPALQCCEADCVSELGGVVGIGSQACQVGCRYAYHQQCEQSHS